MALDYKHKYDQLKNTFLSSVQTSYKLGFEAGLNQAQLQNAQQQASDAQAQLQALQNPQQVDANGQPIQNQPGQPASEQSGQISGQNGPVSGQPSQMGQQPAMDEGQGTELDTHINELEGLISKGQKPSLPELRQKLEQIQDLRKSQRQSKPQAKKVESTQAKLLKNILDGWKQEAPKISNSIADIIAQAEAKVGK
jgi:hypothetical protein